MKTQFLGEMEETDMKNKCETCYYCKMTNGKCHKNKNQTNSEKCKDYVKSTVTR